MPAIKEIQINTLDLCFFLLCFIFTFFYSFGSFVYFSIGAYQTHYVYIIRFSWQRRRIWMRIAVGLLSWSIDPFSSLISLNKNLSFTILMLLKYFSHSTGWGFFAMNLNSMWYVYWRKSNQPTRQNIWKQQPKIMIYIYIWRNNIKYWCWKYKQSMR